VKRVIWPGLGGSTTHCRDCERKRDEQDRNCDSDAFIACSSVGLQNLEASASWQILREQHHSLIALHESELDLVGIKTTDQDVEVALADCR